jgi:hypothetical protein
VLLYIILDQGVHRVAAIFSTSISRGSLSIQISTLTLILLGAGAAAALIGALGRSLVD